MLILIVLIIGCEVAPEIKPDLLTDDDISKIDNKLSVQNSKINEIHNAVIQNDPSPWLKAAREYWLFVVLPLILVGSIILWKIYSSVKCRYKVLEKPA